MFISRQFEACPSRIGSTSILFPVSCLISALRNNRGPETAIPTAPVGAVSRMDSTAMVRIYKGIDILLYYMASSVSGQDEPNPAL